ncbi:MAG: polysaccharide biosynthesis/export family protein [Hyphomonadaceae bacterium]
MNPIRKAVQAVLAFGALVLSACASGPAMSGPDDATPAAAGMNSYRLGSGDEIKVTVYGEPDLSGPFTVDGEGQITMSLIGQVEVGKLTLGEASDKLQTKLKDGWLKDPKVAVELVKGRPYYILGEVNKPGEYPFSSGLTVMNAIASAGDFTYRADKGRILIKSVDSPNEREVDLTPSTQVRPGDTIRIRERLF